MRIIDIVGKNYFGHWEKMRKACRGIIIDESRRILLSYETVTDLWMLPGGGIEDGETERECCRREVAEETGVIFEPSECVLEIDEYYEDEKYASLYFPGSAAGICSTDLTERECEVGMEPRWISVEEALSIFSRHAEYEGKDEMRRGIYLREYTALTEVFGGEKNEIIHKTDAI